MIGPSDDPEDIKQYSNQLLVCYIKEQLIYFPNVRRVLYSWIITAGVFFDSVIIRDEIPIDDTPSF